jgi:transcriptional regulator with XRE-family HTH domain
MHGQGRSTFATGDASRFQKWLRDQLDHYGWSLSQLARELSISKGAVVRWMADPEEGSYRRPAYESLRRLADLFGTDLSLLLEYAGVSEGDDTRHLSTMQREAAGIVSSLPDLILAVVYPQLQSLATEDQRTRVIASIRREIDNQPS